MILHLGWILALSLMSCSPKGFATSSQSSSSDEHPQSGPTSDTRDDAFVRLTNQSQDYRARYALADVFSKLVNNHGDLYPALYGVRNFRVVLHGVYYRGGANNVYNKVDGVRANENPLPASGLQHLCEQGFKESIYLYTTNYSTSPKSVSCVTIKNESNTMSYHQISALTFSNEDQFIQKVYQVIKGERPGPIYGHCWNGWHASGYISAILLKQFCGLSDDEALDYWKRNTDGATEGHEAVMKKVVAFKPFNQYKISEQEAALICPQ